MTSLSFSAACNDLTDSVTRLLTQIGAFVRSVRGARRDLDAVSRELSSLSLCLQTLRDESDEVRYQAGFQGTLSKVIGESNIVVGEMTTLLFSSQTGGRAQWLPATNDEMIRLSHALKSQRSAIEIALEFLSCIWDAEAIATSNSAHNGKTATEKDTRRPSSSNDNEQSQMAALEERVRFLDVQLSRITDNDDGYMIQRLRDVTGFHPESINERKPLTDLFGLNSVDSEREREARQSFQPGQSQRRSLEDYDVSPNDDESSSWSGDSTPPREQSLPPSSTGRDSLRDVGESSRNLYSQPLAPLEVSVLKTRSGTDHQTDQRRLPLLVPSMTPDPLQDSDHVETQKATQPSPDSAIEDSTRAVISSLGQSSSARNDTNSPPVSSHTIQGIAQPLEQAPYPTQVPRQAQRPQSGTEASKTSTRDRAQAPPLDLGQAPTTLAKRPAVREPAKFSVATRSKPETPPKGYIDVEAIEDARVKRGRLSQEQRVALDRKLLATISKYESFARAGSFQRFVLKRTGSNPNAEDFRDLLDLGAAVNNTDPLSDDYSPDSQAPKEANLTTIIRCYFSPHCHEVTSLFLRRGAKITQDCWNQALKSGSAEIVALLISYGADVNAELTEGKLKGRRPLELAMTESGFGRAGIVEILLKYGANVDAEVTKGENKGIRPLELAFTNTHPHWSPLRDTFQLLETMLIHGADPNAVFSTVEFKGKRPLEVAIQNFADDRYGPSAVRSLLRFGADVNLGFPLTAAVKTIDSHLVRLLLENGADATVSGEEKTLVQLVHEAIPLSFASNTTLKWPEMVLDVLKEYGAVE